MSKFQKIRQNPPRLTKFQGMVHCSCANNTQSSKFTRVLSSSLKSGKKTSAVWSGISGDVGTDTKANEVIARPLTKGSKSQLAGQGAKWCDTPSPVRCQSPVVEPESSTGPAGQRQEVMIPISATATSRQANRLRELVRNGGRSFSSTLGSFPSYSRRTLRTIHTRWRSFRETHPAATRYAKWVSWLRGIAVPIGYAVSLPIELYRTFHGLNQTDTVILSHIENVTAQLDRLQNQSRQEFDLYPDQTIFDLYHAPLRRTERGSYRLGIEDVPWSEDDPT